MQCATLNCLLICEDDGAKRSVSGMSSAASIDQHAIVRELGIAKTRRMGTMLLVQEFRIVR